MSREVFNDLIEIFLAHKGKILGILLGLIVAVLILTFGFLEAIFILFCTTAGYYLGRRLDERKNFSGIMDKIIPRQDWEE